MMDATVSRTVARVAFACLLLAAASGVATLVCAADAHAHGQSSTSKDIVVCNLHRGHTADSIAVGTTPIHTNAADTAMVALDGYWLSAGVQRESDSSPPIVHSDVGSRHMLGDRLLL